MSDTHHSPQQSSKGGTTVPWTIDNSASRIASSIENSPRSILKGSKTPNPYLSPQFNRFQNERLESMMNRRVSFASDARVRVYSKNEMPNSPSHRTHSQKLSTTSPDANEINPVPTAISPERPESDNAYISRLSGSPMDRRKRRRDIFGSPPGQRVKRPSVIYPENRVRGMRKLEDEDDESDDEGSHNYFMQFLARDQQGPKRLFDDDDNNNEADARKKDDKGKESQTSRGSSYVSALSPRASQQLSPPLRELSPRLPRELSPTTLFADNDDDDDDTTSNAHQLTAFSQVNDNNTKQFTRTSVYSATDDVMQETQQYDRGKQQGTGEDTTDLWLNTATADISRQQLQGRQAPSHSVVVESQPFTQFSSQKDATIHTQDTSPGPSTTTKDNNNDSFYPINASSPLRSPLESTNNDNFDLRSRMAKSPRVGMSILDTMNASPILPRHSPASRTPSHHASNLFSPKRSFYLHDPDQSHSPPAQPATPRAISKSPLRQEHSIRNDLSEHSIGSDYGDRMMAMNGDEDFNIFAEELPQLYDSFIDDTPTSRPMTLTYFLDTAAGFKQLVEDRPMPRQLNPSKMEHTNAPATVDQKATAAASILPELDAYRKLTEDYEKVNQELTDRLEQLEADLSENIPQVFAEYANASPETVDEMENSFSDLRKLANAETEHEWYTNYISMVQELVALFKDQLKAQLEDQQVLLKAKNQMNENLSQLTAEKQKMTRSIKEAQERIQKYNEMDHELLKKWENDIEEQKAFTERRRKEAQKIEEKEAQARKELESLDKKKEELQLAITKAEETKAAHPYVSQDDLERSKDLYEASSLLCAWKLEEKTDHTIQFNIYGDLDILIDTNKLKNHKVDAVSIRMLESKDREYGPFAELVHGLQVLAKETWNQAKIVQDIAIYWNRLRMIRNEILEVQRRFWIDIEPHIQHPFTDSKMRGFRCKITVFSYVANLKFHLSFDIHAKNVMAYPHCLDLAQLNIEFFYGDTTPEYLDTLVKHKLEELGIVGLVDTLCSIIDDIR